MPEPLYHSAVESEMRWLAHRFARTQFMRLNVPVRIANALIRGGYRTAEQVAADPAGAMCCRNIGPHAVTVVLERLRAQAGAD